MVQTVHMYRRKITGSKHHQIIHQLLLEFLNKIRVLRSNTYNVLLKRRIRFFFRPNKLFHNENGPLITPKNGNGNLLKER